MDETTTTTAGEREPPTFEQLVEERFVAEVRRRLVAWRFDGKPHKR